MWRRCYTRIKETTMNIYYVYAYIRSKDSKTAPAGTPYYIGKGKDNRAYVKHYAPVPVNRCNIVFLKENITELDAHTTEISLIAEYGRKDLGTGILHNRSDGGEGLSNPSELTRQKMSTAKRNESSETKIKRSIAAKNRIRHPLSEETKCKISAANKGRLQSTEAKDKMSKQKTGVPSKKKGIPLSDVVKQKMSVSAKNRSPEAAKRIADANRKRRNNL